MIQPTQTTIEEVDVEQDPEQPAASQVNLHGLKWACEVLDLEQLSTLDANSLNGPALHAFFRDLKSNGFHAETNSADAVEVVYGKSPYLVAGYAEFCLEEQLDSLDDVVQWYASQLGEQETESPRDQLRARLDEFSLQTSISDVRKYAEQIKMAAQVADSPENHPNPAARKLARAAFHISAIRPSRRRQVRSRWVQRIRNEFSHDEIVVAKRIVQQKYKVPSETFHRPFFGLLTWGEGQVDEVRIGQPVSSGTQTVVAYSKDFGVANPANSQPSKGTNWGWIGFAVFFGVIVSAIARMPGPKNTGNDVSPPDKSKKVHVFVFDKDDPNKYAVEFVDLADSFGRPTTLTRSKEHPGPFVNVQLDEINRDDSVEAEAARRKRAAEELGRFPLLPPDARKELEEQNRKLKELRKKDEIDPLESTSPKNPIGLPARLPPEVEAELEKSTKENSELQKKKEDENRNFRKLQRDGLHQ